MPQPDEEQTPSIFDDEAAQLLRRRLSEGIAKTRNVLYLVAGMLFVTDLLGIIVRLGSFALQQDMLMAAIDGLLIAALVSLGFVAKKQPFYALLAGLIIYVLVQAAAIMFHIVIMQHSPIISLMILGLLFSGLRRAQVIQRTLQLWRDRAGDAS